MSRLKTIQITVSIELPTDSDTHPFVLDRLSLDLDATVLNGGTHGPTPQKVKYSLPPYVLPATVVVSSGPESSDMGSVRPAISGVEALRDDQEKP